MTAGELCIREVVIVRREQSIIEAARLMREHHVGDLVIIEEEDGQRIPVGILTDRDLVVGVLALDLDHLHTLAVGDVVIADLVTAREEESYADVIKRMRSFGVRRIPVVNEKGGLEGILSMDDLLGQISEELSDLAGLIAREQDRERDQRG
jgi:CBS domain-containing protein